MRLCGGGVEPKRHILSGCWGIGLLISGGVDVSQ
jgi:hypothetical protein